LACNLIYVELSSRMTHGQGCDRDENACSGRCDWARFHAELEAPLLPHEIREDLLARERLKVLMSGEIPA
jgi:hypothetical protein